MSSKEISIFPISYFKDNIEDNQKIKDLLVDKIVKDSENLKVPENWNTNKIKTSFLGEPPGKEIFFGDDRTYQSVLEQRYSKCLDSFFENASYTISIDEIWYNCYIDGEYQEFHDHLGGPLNPSHYSCVHFLSFDPSRHRPIKFQDPSAQIKTTTELNYKPNYYPNIEEGDFIMFPSYLKHSVEPSPSTPDYPRITISMNIKILKYNQL